MSQILVSFIETFFTSKKTTPFHWLAIEFLTSNIFFYKSEVWAFEDVIEPMSTFHGAVDRPVSDMSADGYLDMSCNIMPAVEGTIPIKYEQKILV